MLRTLVEHELQLKSDQSRSFIVSVSGGLDSTVLAVLLSELKKDFPIELRLLHLNFNLRRKESILDAQSVKRLAKKLDLDLDLVSLKTKRKTGVQDWARNERLKATKTYPRHWEIIEAHHGDDQIETFFLRLFRGAGLKGLSSIQPSSVRENRRVWRPFLKVSKEELKAYARAKKIRYREDSTNLTTQYDRNWIRHKVLPAIQARFPTAKAAILRAVESLQEDEFQFSKRYREIFEAASQGTLSNTLRWKVLRTLPQVEAQRFIHRYFGQEKGLALNRHLVQKLADSMSTTEPFTHNLPRGFCVRGLPESRKRPDPLIQFGTQKTIKSLDLRE